MVFAGDVRGHLLRTIAQIPEAHKQARDAVIVSCVVPRDGLLHRVQIAHADRESQTQAWEIQYPVMIPRRIDALLMNFAAAVSLPAKCLLADGKRIRGVADRLVIRVEQSETELVVDLAQHKQVRAIGSAGDLLRRNLRDEDPVAGVQHIGIASLRQVIVTRVVPDLRLPVSDVVLRGDIRQPLTLFDHMPSAHSCEPNPACREAERELYFRDGLPLLYPIQPDKLNPSCRALRPGVQPACGCLGRGWKIPARVAYARISIHLWCYTSPTSRVGRIWDAGTYCWPTRTGKVFKDRLENSQRIFKGRMPQEAKQIYEFGPFQISAAERVLRRADRIVPLTPKCFDTLLVLARHGGSVVDKEELIRTVWPDSFVEEGNLSQNIFALRKVLGAPPEGEQYIETIRKRGYRLAVPVASTRRDGTALEAVAHYPRTERSPLRRVAYIIMAAALGAIALVAARWSWRSGDGQDSAPQVSLVPIPNDILAATISQDGKQIAYVSSDAGGQSLWVRETRGMNAGTRLIPPAPGHYWGVVYSPSGKYLYYVFNEEAHPADSSLFRISASGREQQELLTGVSSAPAFSPDGLHMVLKRYDPHGRGYLLTATPLGRDIKVIAQSDAAYPFYNYYWAADGRTIYYVERTNDANKNAWSIWEMPATGGARRPLMAPQPKPLRGVNWLSRSEILALIPDEDSGLRQIWRVSLDEGFRRLTNGINDCSSISVTADGRTVLATNVETHDNIWVLPGHGSTPPIRMSLPAGTYNHPAWTSDGHVLFVDQSNLWLSTTDGINRKPLIPEKVIPHELSVSADGRFVVFVSERNNMRNLWRIDIDGHNLRQVTTGQFDWHPAVSPDGKWVVYESRVPAPWRVWKAPLDMDGAPIKLVDNEGAEDRIAISPDSKLFAYRTDVGGICIRSLESGKLKRSITAPLDPSDLQWSPDGMELRYVTHTGRAVQLWSQPIGGGPPVRIKERLPNDVLHVNWSHDGRIVYLDREIKADLTLITNFR